MPIKIQRRKGPKQFSSAVISSFVGVSGVFLLAKAAWPYPQDRLVTVVRSYGCLLSAWHSFRCVTFRIIWRTLRVWTKWLDSRTAYRR